MAKVYDFETMFCTYKTEQSILLMKSDETMEHCYYITIYFDTQCRDLIKITIINTKNEEESYTCILMTDTFALLREEQDLLVNFEEFPNALKVMFSQCSPQGLYLKMSVEENIVYLGFYTKSQLKELIVLKLPFKFTSADDIILYFKRQILGTADENKRLLQKTQSLENELTEFKAKHEETLSAFREYKEKYETLLAKQDETTLEIKRLKMTLKRCEDEKLILAKGCDNLEANSIELQKTLNTAYIDLGSMKIGIDHYMKKSNSLQQLLDNTVRSTVPITKYKCLMKMFSTAVADLMKSQLFLKQVSSLNELQKSDNKTLKDELAHCIETIKSMELNLKTEKTLAISSKRNKLIAALEKKLQASQTLQSNPTSDN
ncbi:hypothetical protein CBL_14118 [Carabus blaptoides fortunei]